MPCKHERYFTMLLTQQCYRRAGAQMQYSMFTCGYLTKTPINDSKNKLKFST